MKRILITISSAVMLALIPANVHASGGNSGAAHLCHHGGHASLVGAAGETFATPGACVAFATRGGTFGPLIVIPARSQAIISNVSFGGACDPLTYGYQLDGGPTVEVDSKPFACPYTEPVDGATIGPFATDQVLRIVLEDTYCGGGPNHTYYSDGNHALVTPTAPGTFLVDINDSLLCFFTTANPRPPSGPGQADLRLTVTIIS